MDILEHSGIYKITCSANNKLYIGSAKILKERWRLHKVNLSTGKHPNKHLLRAWNKYGGDQFIFEVLLVCETKDLLFYEQLCIDKYEAYTKGFNRCPIAGSNLGRKSSDETKAKISKAKTGMKYSEESRLKRSITLKNLPNRNEVNKKIGNALRGKKKPEGMGARVSNSKKGKPQSEAHKDALKLAWAKRKLDSEKYEQFIARQRINSRGKVPSEETKIKLSNSSKLMWIRRKGLI